MKKILLSILLIAGSSLSGNSSSGIGEAGSKVDSLQVNAKIELIKTDDTTVTVLDGNEFLELKTDGDTTGVAEALEANRPPNGTYKGIILTVTKFKHKLKIVSGATTYYTTNKEVPNGKSWDLSTDEKDYGYTTELAVNGKTVTTVTFPKPLVLTAGQDANLVFVNQFDPSVLYQTEGTIETLHWAGQIRKMTGVLPAQPTQSIVFDINYTDGTNNLDNTVTAFLDDQGNLIGAHMMRPDNQALNGSFLLGGSKTDNDYTFRFQNGDDNDDGINGDDYYDINATINCTNSNYLNLTIQEVQDGGDPKTAQPNNSNDSSYTLTTSGSATCTDLNI